MSEYVLAYTGGGRPETEEQQQEVMAAWGAWFEQLGEAIVDGGAPFGPSSILKGDGSVAEGNLSALTGYTVLSADSLDQAVAHAKGCPILNDGGNVEVYEKLPM